MPRKVDAAARRQDVVDALFRVAVRDGLARVSLRGVADEARLNIGSLRHYFDSQLELMRFAMRAMLDGVAARVRARLDRLPAAAPRPERVDHAVALLGELLPVDDARRSEVTVFLDFLALARTRPELSDLAAEAATGTRGAAHRVLAYVTGAAPDPIEVERLTSLLDGLGVNAVLHPDLVPPSTAESVLRTHLTTVD